MAKDTFNLSIVDVPKQGEMLHIDKTVNRRTIAWLIKFCDVSSSSIIKAINDINKTIARKDTNGKEKRIM